MNTPEQIIKQALQKGKISGSWLIVGPKGVGKKTFARKICSLLTQGIFQDMPQTDGHSDIKWIDYALTDEAKKEVQKTILAGKLLENTEKFSRKKEITVDDIRAGLQFLSLKPGQGRYRILVVAAADDMNESAANALLKILEEPGAQSVILLISCNTGRLLPTIRSRCRQIHLSPLSETELTDLISQCIPDFKDPVLLAQLSAGSIGLAKELAAHNGIAIYQNIQSLLNPKGFDIAVLDKFADTLIKDDTAFDLFCELLLNELATQAKERACQGDKTSMEIINLFNECNILMNDIKVLYLDKKQTIKTIFFKSHRVFK